MVKSSIPSSTPAHNSAPPIAGPPFQALICLPSCCLIRSNVVLYASCKPRPLAILCSARLFWRMVVAVNIPMRGRYLDIAVSLACGIQHLALIRTPLRPHFRITLISARNPPSVVLLPGPCLNRSSICPPKPILSQPYQHLRENSPPLLF